MGVKKILGLDFGTTKVGVALADTLIQQARPLCCLSNKHPDQLLKNLKALVDEWRITLLVVGYPHHNILSPVHQACDAFLEKLKILQCPIDVVNETYSSQVANQLLQQHPGHNKDALAAMLIAQAWCDEPNAVSHYYSGS